MARRRKRRSSPRFRGTEAQHRRRSAADAAELRHKLSMLRRTIAGGECGRALTWLTSAYREAGAYGGERAWVRRGAGKMRVGTRGLESLKSRFVKKCMT